MFEVPSCSIHGLLEELRSLPVMDIAWASNLKEIIAKLPEICLATFHLKQSALKQK